MGTYADGLPIDQPAAEHRGRRRKGRARLRARSVVGGRSCARDPDVPVHRLREGFLTPDRVTSLPVVAIGTQGTAVSVGPNTGGRGAPFTADVALTPGQFLRVDVGRSCSGATSNQNAQ